MSELTQEDIARQAGVSHSTVARVVNDPPGVREGVRKRTQNGIQSTSYHPNAAARTLAPKHSWMIGLIIPRSVSSSFTDPYFPRLTQGVVQACNQYDYALDLFYVGTKEEEEKILPRISRKDLLDGILVQSGQIGDQLIDHLVSLNIPLVFVGRPFQPHDEISYIDVDNVNGAYTAVSHLIRLGYQRIGTITGPANSTAGIDRKEGYLQAFLERGRDVDETLISMGDFTESSGYCAMQQLLTVKPDAVFVASALMTLGAMRAAREANLSIPDDIAFIGFDDLPLVTSPEPQLTTVRPPIYQLELKAVEILLDLIENGIKPARRILVSTELIIRNSCGTYRRV